MSFSLHASAMTRDGARRFPRGKEKARVCFVDFTVDLRDRHCFRFNFVGPVTFLAPLNKTYFLGSRFTSGEIPFINLTSDSYKFFPVLWRADVDGRRRFSFASLENVNIFGFPAPSDHALRKAYDDVKDARCNRSMHLKDTRPVVHQNTDLFVARFKLGSARPHALPEKKTPTRESWEGLRISFRTGVFLSFDSSLREVDIER